MNEASETHVEKTEADGSQPLSNETSPEGSTEGQESESVESCKVQIQQLREQLKEKESKYLYLYADFDNFKKRSIRERSDLIKFGWESVARDLLQSLDNLERALSHIPANTDPSLIEGLKLVTQQFKASLQKQGVQTIPTVGKAFDPHLHEAVGTEESALPSGSIVREELPGYTLHGRLLRPARVTISVEKKA